MAKKSGIKVKLYIKDATTGKVLGSQKNATLNKAVESIDADRTLVDNDTAFSLLEDSFKGGANVTVYLEFPNGAKYEGIATITDFPLKATFDDLATYSITLQSNGASVKAAV